MTRARPARLVLVRHGESAWNYDDRFTGWTDVGLTARGRRQAASAGRCLRSFPFRKAFSSNLKRTRESLTLILQAAGQTGVPVKSSAALDERNYGRLQGLVKRETVLRFGARQVQKWRRAWTAKPPGGESLKDAAARILPYFRTHVLRAAVRGANILLVAHGNTLRVIAMELEGLTPKQVEALNFGTGAVLMYEFDLAGDILSRRMLIDGADAEIRPSTKGERP